MTWFLTKKSFTLKTPKISASRFLTQSFTLKTPKNFSFFSLSPRDDAILQLMPSCWKAIQSTNSQLRLAALRVALLMPPEALAKLLRHPGDPTESWVGYYFKDFFFVGIFWYPKTWGKSKVWLTWTCFFWISAPKSFAKMIPPIFH